MKQLYFSKSLYKEKSDIVPKDIILQKYNVNGTCDILSAVSIIVGIVILIPGIVSIIEFFKTKSNFKLILGIVSCVIGFIFIFSSKFVASILPFILGIYFLIMVFYHLIILWLYLKI